MIMKACIQYHTMQRRVRTQHGLSVIKNLQYKVYLHDVFRMILSSHKSFLNNDKLKMMMMIIEIAWMCWINCHHGPMWQLEAKGERSNEWIRSLIMLLTRIKAIGWESRVIQTHSYINDIIAYLSMSFGSVIIAMHICVSVAYVWHSPAW